MLSFKIFDVIETSYEDNTYWICYGDGTRYTYEIIEGKELEKVLQFAKKEYDETERIPLNTCSYTLQELIKDCEMSTNDMIFAENEIYHFTKKDIENLNQEIRNLELDDYVRFYEDDCPITVYGGIITKFIFE